MIFTEFERVISDMQYGLAKIQVEGIKKVKYTNDSFEMLGKFCRQLQYTVHGEQHGEHVGAHEGCQ